MSPKNVVFLKTFNSEFLDVKVWFTDQNLKITGSVFITLSVSYAHFSQI